MKKAMILTTALLVVLMLGTLLEAHPGHHGHHGHHFRPVRHHRHWTRYVPRIVIGGTTRTVVVREPQVVINNDACYTFPGPGGAWVTFGGRPAYQYGAYLYIPAGMIGDEMMYRRVYCP